MKTFNLFMILVLVVGLALVVGLVPVAQATSSTIEVSQPVQVTNDSHYERGQAIVFDGNNYWLFYGRSASVTGNYQNDNPDVHDYAIYYKKASSVTELAGATANAVPGATDSYLGEIGAAVLDGTVWTFATLPSTNHSGRKSLYGWYTSDEGGNWTQVADLADNLPPGAAHHDEVAFNNELYVMVNYPDGNTGWHTKHTADPTASSWSDYVPLNSADNLINGTGHFFVDDGALYIGLLRTSPTKDNKVLEYSAGPLESWTELASASSTGWDPTLFKVGSSYVLAQAPWSNEGGGRQYIIAWSGSSLSNVLDGSDVMVSAAKYGTNTWVDMWPIGFTDNDGKSYLFFTSERKDPGEEGTGNIWYLPVTWDVTNDHYTYIQNAIDAATSTTINVAAGTYTEAVTINPGADLTIQGAGRDVTTWIAPADDASRMHCLECSLENYTSGATTLDISGFTFSVEDNAISTSGIGILINHASQAALYLSIHDNKFVETTTITDETANSMLLCHNRYAARGTEAPVKIYNNLDETAGGIAMSNSRAFDIYNNTFDGGSDALYIGYGCPANTTIGDHHIYNNTFKNASNTYPDPPWPSIFFTYYGSGTGMTFLPSTIEGNTFEDNDLAIGYNMESNIEYPDDVIQFNNFNNNDEAMRVWGPHATTVNAKNNWWGTPFGPNGENPAGKPVKGSDNVSGNVDYDPWLKKPFQANQDHGGNPHPKE